MMKYRNVTLLLLTSTLILSGCANKPEPEEDSQTTPAPIIKEVESLPDADITIPAGLVGTEIANSDQKDDQSTNNADGTVTISLNGEQRTAIVNQLSADITQSIQAILDDDEYYPDIVSITPSEDCTVFTIALADGQMNTYESMLVMSYYILGDKYQLYAGVPEDEVKTTVVYVNDTTGEVIYEADSTSMDTFTTK